MRFKLELTVNMNKEATTSGRGGERGRNRARRGRGRGRGVRETTAETEPQLVLQNVINTMPTSVTAEEYHAQKLAEQAERLLLPDAPPRKRARNDSPERVQCCLVEGTAAVPSPPRLRSQLRQTKQPIVKEKASTSSTSVSPPPNLQSQQTHIPESAFGGTLLPKNLCQYLLQHSTQSPVLASPPKPQVLESPQPLTITSCSDDELDQLTLEWLPESSDSEEDESTVVLENIEYTTEEPAHLPEDINNDCAHSLQRQDADADRLLTGLLTRDRTEHMTFEWTNDKDTFLGRRENFVGSSGPTFALETTDRPLDVFLRYFDDEVFNLIVSGMNRICDHLKTKTFTKHSRLNKLKETDKSEIAIFLAVLVLQDLLPLEVEKDYFKDNGYLTLKYFKSLMPYKRFVLLKRLLLLTDNNDESTIDNNKLRKLAPLLNLLQSKFKGLYLPSRDITIDESLLKWHGRLNFGQKIATKASRVGIKTYELCESSTGYCWDFFIYPGNGHTHNGHDRENTDRLETDGRDNDRQETDGRDTEKQDNDRQETDGRDTERQDNDRQETDGRDTERQDNARQETDGRETERQDNDRQETDGRETERQDNDRQETNGRGTERQDNDRQETNGRGTERQDNDRQGDEPVMPRNLTAQIVLNLVRPLLNRGHTLVMANFDNSPLLARYLKENKTDCFGTLRVNREFVPEAIKNISKSLRPGEMVQSYCRDLSVVLWRDSNTVALISTMHAGEVGGKEKYGNSRSKPQVLIDYNLAMAAVGKKDQLLSAHTIERNETWYKRVFRRLLNVTILNAYIVYKTQHPHTSIREFRTSLANELIATFRPPQPERPPVDAVEEVCVIQRGQHRRTILKGNHFVGTNPTKNSRCKYCKKARTRYMCKQCNESLCLNVCFEKYHTSS